jgi:tripartite-type tricarboxylate transporter receptor subunit TctC
MNVLKSVTVGVALALALAQALVPGTAKAAYPDKPIRLIVPGRRVAAPTPLPGRWRNA